MTKTEWRSKLLETGYFVDNEFLDRYLDLVLSDEPQTGYTEKHHILQKKYFKLKHLKPDSSKENLVRLSYTNHVRAHYYLYKCTLNELYYANISFLNTIIAVVSGYTCNRLAIGLRLTEAELTEFAKYKEEIVNDPNSRYWKESEIKTLRENYGKGGPYACPELFVNHTYNAIVSQAHALGIEYTESRWLQKDDEFLIANYAKLGAVGCKPFLHREASAARIKAHARALGVKFERVDLWTAEEDQVLLDNYNKLPNKVICELLPDRTRSSIKHRAFLLGITKDGNLPYTEEEDAIIRQYIGKETYAELAKHMPGRTASSVKARANNVLKLTVKDRYLEEEDQIIKQYYKVEGINGLMSRLPARTKRALQDRIHELGLGTRVSLPYTEEDITKIRLYYPDHAGDVEFWAIIMPGRPYKSIRVKAAKLKIHSKNYMQPKKVRCIETGIIYATQAEVLRLLGIHIEAAIKNPSRTAGGYHWEFVE